MSNRTLSQMFAAADATTSCAPGTCLHNCAEWWLGRASGESDAFLDEQRTPHDEWLAATDKATHAEIGLLAHWRHTPAASARHNMADGHPGHIAPVRRIDADGTVWVRSTDMAADGTYKAGSVATVRLTDVTRAMGLIFDGYSRQIAGVLVVPAPKVRPVHVQHALDQARQTKAAIKAAIKAAPGPVQKERLQDSLKAQQASIDHLKQVKAK